MAAAAILRALAAQHGAPSPLREALHDVHHTLAGGAVSHEEALRLSERARRALDGDTAIHGADPDPYWARLSWDLAAVVDGWVCDSADEWTRDDEGAKTASGRFDAAFLVGRIQRVLRDRLGAEGQNSIASPATPAPDARQAVVEAALLWEDAYTVAEQEGLPAAALDEALWLCGERSQGILRAARAFRRPRRRSPARKPGGRDGAHARHHP
jgi:hypothetical protein